MPMIDDNQMNVYQEWIKNNYPTPESAKLQCKEGTDKMVQSFQELRQVRGYAYVGTSKRPHWWCETPDGEIIDPTAIQYGAIKPFHYEEVGSEESHGKCIECGELLFRSKGDESYFCAECK
jgi:hypothetical protein